MASVFKAFVLAWIVTWDVSHWVPESCPGYGADPYGRGTRVACLVNHGHFATVSKEKRFESWKEAQKFKAEGEAQKTEFSVEDKISNFKIHKEADEQ